MRRGTLITIIVLFGLIAVAAVFQVLAVADKPRNCPGPGLDVDPDTEVRCGPDFAPSPTR